MARRETEREDLIRDAVAMVDRVEFIGDSIEPTVIGFREDGSASIYFGHEPVYHFTSDYRLRRVYQRGIIKAENRQLIRWDKRRQAGEVRMYRIELSDAEQSDLLRNMQDRLTSLRDKIRRGSVLAARHVNQPGSNATARAVRWLDNLPREFQIADAPNAR